MRRETGDDEDAPFESNIEVVQLADGSVRRELNLPLPLNCHAHLLDTLIPGRPPNDVRKAVVGPDSFKHAGIGRLMAELSETSFKERFLALHPAFAGNVVEFREGGVKGAGLGRLGRDHFLMGRPDGSDLDELIPMVDGIAVSGINDHPGGYAEMCREAAAEAGKPFALHASESVREDIESILALEPDFLVHMCKATRSDLSRVADLRLPVVVCPRATAYFGGAVPLKMMMDAGVRVVVGTDNGMVCAPFPYMEVQHLMSVGGISLKKAIALLEDGADAFSPFMPVISGRKSIWMLRGGESPLSALSRPPDRIV